MIRHSRACPLRHHRTASRRGSVYVLALGASTLVAITGLSVIAIARAKGRAADAEQHAVRAELACRSAIEVLTVGLNATPTWRRDVKNRGPIGPMLVDGETAVTLYVEDLLDGNLADNATQPVRVTAVGRTGKAVRALSVTLTAMGTAGLDCLRASAFSAGTMSIKGPGTLSAGLLASNGQIAATTGVIADVEAGSVTSSSFIQGRVTTGAAAKTVPDDAAWTTLSALATPIPSNSKFDTILLSAASNPFGSANPRGVYSIVVPSGTTLEVKKSRICATLLVTLTGSAEMKFQDEVFWQPPASDLPTLIVNGTGTKGVNMEMNEKVLDEGSKNFNPVGSPYNGVTDNDKSDTYPNRLEGVIHIMNASTPVVMKKHSTIAGSLIAAGTVTIQEEASLSPIASLLTSPPIGYARSTGIVMRIEPGTYQWQVSKVAAADASADGK